MRRIKKIHQPEYAPMGDLVTYRVLPTHSVKYIDPFLFLNHHGPQQYPPGNSGLPFGPHPHRGMETVTFIMAGDIVHKDNSGHNSEITAGGIQWMTAGSGIIHSEVSSAEFMRSGGRLEILQLWINLPSSLKMTRPVYTGLQKENIPALEQDGGKVKVNIVSGQWDGTGGAFESLTGVALFTLHFEKGGTIACEIPQKHNVFFYVISGNLTVNGTRAPKLSLVEFENEGTGIGVIAEEDSTLLLGHALPLEEQVVFGGPFVMNTQQEIDQAYEDYRSGKFGAWLG